jgi:hypothetical protein
VSRKNRRMIMPTIYESSFEVEGFTSDDTHLVRPNGWDVSYVDGSKPGPVRPEIQPEDTERGDRGVHSGRYGVKLTHAYAFYDAALYKRFTVGEGTEVEFYAWTTADSPGLVAGRVGIDPYGGTDHKAGSVVWSEWYGTANPGFEPYRWQQLMSIAIAQADTITVFLGASADDAVQYNSCFFDDIKVWVDDESPDPEPEPEPEYTQVVDVPINGTLRLTLSINTDVLVTKKEYIPAAPNLIQRILGR